MWKHRHEVRPVLCQPLVPRVPVDNLLVTVQEGTCHHRVDKAGVRVDTDMRLHAEEPLLQEAEPETHETRIGRALGGSNETIISITRFYKLLVRIMVSFNHLKNYLLTCIYEHYFVALHTHIKRFLIYY